MSGHDRIFVTGAGGFIGGHVVERFHLAGAPVIAGLRQWSSAARIGRFPVEMRLCDILDPAQVRHALQGVSAIVHCAVGDRDVTVQGTRNLLDAAALAGVRRFVHLSTVDVYGSSTGAIDETAARTSSGTPYSDNKIAAEQVCDEYMDGPVPITVLRPAIVYGPFSKLWTVRFAERLLSRKFGIGEGAGLGTCNLVYVDDVVRAVELALERDDAVRQAFNVNGSEQPRWVDYIEAFNEALGLPPMPTPSSGRSRVKARALMPARSAAKMVLGRFRKQIMGLYTRYDTAKRLIKLVEGEMKVTPTPSELALYERKVFYAPDKARRMLGYVPQFSMADGLDMSVQWLRHHGLAGERS